MTEYRAQMPFALIGKTTRYRANLALPLLLPTGRLARK